MVRATSYLTIRLGVKQGGRRWYALNALERRQQIVDILRVHQKVTMGFLSQRFGVSRRTIRTDIEHLSLTYPIQTIRGRYNGGVLLLEEYRSKGKRLTPAQCELLHRVQLQMDDTDKEIVQSILLDFA